MRNAAERERKIGERLVGGRVGVEGEVGEQMSGEVFGREKLEREMEAEVVRGGDRDGEKDGLPSYGEVVKN